MIHQKKNKLWTYDFTVITIGSIVSVVGGALSGFGICLLVLDHTDSTFRYTLSIVVYQLPMLVCPVLAGTFLDRVSRKRVIYTLDFISFTIFSTLFLLLRSGWFNYTAMLIVCLIQGTIDSVYLVAYDSFYPNVVTEGNYRKAYSVSSMLQPIAAMMTPVAAVFYDVMGSVAPIFALNAVCFLVAACFERTIRYQETHMDSASHVNISDSIRRFRCDLKQGVEYIRSERGLMVIAVYFMCFSFVCRADNLQLPFFRNHPELFAGLPIAAITLYTIVSNCGVAGRVVGGIIQYEMSIPGKYKTMIAIGVYVGIGIISGIALFLPIPLMIFAFFINGILGITANTLRSSACQAYVVDTKRARFNGTFHMLSAIGGVTGSLVVGILGEYFSERAIILGMHTFGLLIVYALMYRNRKYIEPIFNQEL